VTAVLVAAAVWKESETAASPANLPVELPSQFELAVNLRTARALRLTIPRAVVLRADEVIQ
jgi:putative ABC transport system substrate-binding protein